MLVFQWNALRVGDQVRVHADLETGLPLHDGVVTLVETHPRQTNDVAIRIDGGAGPIVHPRRHAVHLGRGDANAGCWRCETPSGRAT